MLTLMSIFACIKNMQYFFLLEMLKILQNSDSDLFKNGISSSNLSSSFSQVTRSFLWFYKELQDCSNKGPNYLENIDFFTQAYLPYLNMH